jgi:hypothetical protein
LGVGFFLALPPPPPQKKPAYASFQIFYVFIFLKN